MATIDPNGVLIYQDTDNYTPIQTALNLAQSNLSSLLGASTQIVRVSSVGDRNAKATARGSISKANPFVAWRADAADGLQLEYTTNGTTWDTIASKAYYDSLDTGWQNVTLASGFSGSVRVRQVEKTVEVYWTCSTSIAAGAAVVVVSAGGIPAAYRPTVQNRPAAVFGSGLPMHAEVGVDGSITVRNAHTSAIPSHRGSTVYLVG